MNFEFIKVKTRIVQPPKDEIWDIIDGLDIRDRDVIFITSKILAIHQGRCIHALNTDKEALIKQESTHWLPYENHAGFKVNLTITDNILIPAAGIDESNANGHFILWPKNTDQLCADIRIRLIKRTGITNLGVVSTDSHTTPLRWGVTGITTGIAGVKPLKNLKGEKDIFGRKMQFTQVDIADALAGMAVLLMGETGERVPIVILRGFNDIEFSDNASMEDFKILPKDDLYSPLLKVMTKNKF